MNDYYEVRFDLNPCTEDATDLLAAMLGDIGYESFVPDADGLSAYIQASLYDAKAVDEIVLEFPFDLLITSHATLVPGRDWNEEWEKHYFQPIVVNHRGKPRAVIHSSFHTDFPAAPYNIVIDPKMAFGTGHHATTSQIISLLLDLPLQGKSVIDMGTGTGILAILAAMRGASPVTAIEIDACAYENAVENASVNGHPEVRLIHGDASALAGVDPADFFIANINRNIITADLPAYTRALKSGGLMVLSGFYDRDIPVVCAAAEPLGLRFEKATAMRSHDDAPSVANIDSTAPQHSADAPDMGHYGAVEAAAPDAAWACLILRKL